MSHLNRQQLFVGGISLVLFLSVAAKSALAIASVEFPSCLNPQVTASQVNIGTSHGVVGKNTPYSGTDSIYQLNNDNVLQCLCTNNGTGIQTNWLRVGVLSQNDINDLIGQGWVYIDNGELWGLKSGPYLAKNIEYTCHSTSGSSNGTSAGVTLQQGVLGLAGTGNLTAIYGLIMMGLILFFVGTLLSRVKHTK
jgi:hypothetical protein